MSWLAIARPDAADFPLFVHIAGATVFVGALLSSVSLIGFARGHVPFLRLGYWTLLVVALPAYVLLRVGGEWTYRKEGFDDEGAPEPTWLDIGFIVANLGALLLVLALVVGGVGMYQLREGQGRGGGWFKATMIIALLILAAAVLAAWAMAGKPD
jgi:hypothetical protein